MIFQETCEKNIEKCLERKTCVYVGYFETDKCKNVGIINNDNMVNFVIYKLYNFKREGRSLQS